MEPSTHLREGQVFLSFSVFVPGRQGNRGIDAGYRRGGHDGLAYIDHSGEVRGIEQSRGLVGFPPGAMEIHSARLPVFSYASWKVISGTSRSTTSLISSAAMMVGRKLSRVPNSPLARSISCTRYWGSNIFTSSSSLCVASTLPTKAPPLEPDMMFGSRPCSHKAFTTPTWK